MRRIRFRDAQIITIPKAHATGPSMEELCRKHGISDGAVCKLWSRCGGMEPSDAERLRALEAENARLKKRLAESVLDVSTRPDDDELRDRLKARIERPCISAARRTVASLSGAIRAPIRSGRAMAKPTMFQQHGIFPDMPNETQFGHFSRPPKRRISPPPGGWRST